jgi:hypothetical protein
LHEHFIPVDFVAVFTELDVDTLRPHPCGIYPGISTDPDCSIEPVIGLEPAAAVNLAESGPDDDQDAPEDDLNIGLADILDEPPAPPELMAQAGDDWLEREGQKYYKASLLRIMFCSGFMRKSKERLEHVRDYTAASIKPSVNQDNESLLNIAVFMVGDLFTSLVRTGKTVSLAVLQSTGIDHNSRKVSAISAAELEVEKLNIILSGQVLHLALHSINPPLSGNLPHEIDSTSLGSESIPSSLDISGTNVPEVSAICGNESLIWNGDYVKFNALKAKKDKGLQSASTGSTNVVSRNTLQFAIPSTFTHPVARTLIRTADLTDMNNQALTSHGLHETWEFDLSILREIAVSLWEKAAENSWKLLELSMSFNNSFPYAVNDGVFDLAFWHSRKVTHKVFDKRPSDCCSRDRQSCYRTFKNYLLYLRTSTSLGFFETA